MNAQEVKRPREIHHSIFCLCNKCQKVPPLNVVSDTWYDNNGKSYTATSARFNGHEWHISYKVYYPVSGLVRHSETSLNRWNENCRS